MDALWKKEDVAKYLNIGVEDVEELLLDGLPFFDLNFKDSSERFNPSLIDKWLNKQNINFIMVKPDGTELSIGNPALNKWKEEQVIQERERGKIKKDLVKIFKLIANRVVCNGCNLEYTCMNELLWCTYQLNLAALYLDREEKKTPPPRKGIKNNEDKNT